MSIGILILLGVVAAAFLAFKVGDVFSPWFLTVIVWFGILLMFQFDTLLYPLGDRFYTSLLLWIPIFCGASILTYYALPSTTTDNKHKEPMQAIEVNNTIFNVLFYLSLVLTPLYLYRIMQTIMMFDTSDMLYNLRILAVHGEQSYGILNYTYVINMSLLAVGIWHYPKIPLWKLLAIYFVCGISAFAIMEKGMIFFFLAATVFVLYEKRVIRMRTIIIWGLVIVVLFFLMNMARDSSELDDDERMTFLDFLAVYLLSPSVAYDRISEDMSGQWGTNTFYTVYLFLNRFGFNFEQGAKLQDFVWVPLPTNVYTIFQPFYQDFGQKGIAMFALLYGTLSGWVYRLFRNGSRYGRCIYIYFVYVLVLQFFQDNLLQSTVIVLQFLFFVWLMTQQKYYVNWGNDVK